MNKNAQKSIGWTLLLILFGIVALSTGVKSLFVLIPAAMLIWYGAWPSLRSGRN